MARRDRKNDTEILLSLASDVELFHSPEGEPYATVEVGDHRETWPIGHEGFRSWLDFRFFRKKGRPPAQAALRSALNILKAKAKYDGDEHTVYARVGEVDETTVVLDLCNDQWEAVVIDRDGWEVVSDPPVKFRRARGMRELPAPQLGGSIRDLRPLVNVATEDDFILLVSFLLASLRPRGPFPILSLVGEQGSAKSTQMRIVRSLVDPYQASLRAPPCSERDLAVAANNSWLLSFDNLSGLSPTLSDALCRLATGGGFSTRKLYTDNEETLFDSKRPIMLNGIDDSVVRGDLLDRCITLFLPSLPAEERRSERELWSAVEQATPLILGALLDAVGCGLGRLDRVVLKVRPRMADFAEWTAACEKALPWAEGAFIRAYEHNRSLAVGRLVESDSVASTIMSLVEEEPFEGTMSELLTELDEIVGERASRSSRWPQTARQLGDRVRRAKPCLLAVGIELEQLPRRASQRPWRIEKSSSEGSSDFEVPLSAPQPLGDDGRDEDDEEFQTLDEDDEVAV